MRQVLGSAFIKVSLIKKIKELLFSLERFKTKFLASLEPDPLSIKFGGTRCVYLHDERAMKITASVLVRKAP
jgi:hypothetical protein